MPRPRSFLVLSAFILLTFLTGPGGLIGAPGSGSPLPAYVPGEVLLRLKPTAHLADKQLLQAELGAVTANEFRSRAEHWRLGPGVSVERAIQRLQASPSVEYAEPNYVLTADVVPNDPRYAELWGMNNTGQTGGTNDADIDAETAWNVSTGSADVLVAVIDTGIDYNHPDLAANVWTNPGEIAGNGVDDDGNGYVDDIHGYDFVNNDGDPFDDNGHGTHCSGTIGGVGNNGIGVAGVNWTVRIMGAKFLSSGGSGSTANAVLAVQYTTMMGVDLTSNSWGGGSFSQTLYDAIAAAGAQNIAFVAAAGNNGANSDTSPAYPAAYDLPNIISVAATDHNDQLASFSNYGAVSVDLGAPGVNVLSTLPGNQYGLLSGTSMACPHVAGAYALVKAVSAPDIPVAQVKNILMNSADDIPALAGRCVSNGRLNIFFAIAEPDVTAPGMINDLATTDASSNTIGVTWTATGDDGAVGTANSYELRFSTAPIDDGNWAAATRAGNVPAPGIAGTPQAMEVRNLVADTTYYFAIKAFDEWGNAGALSNIATGTTLPPPTGQVDPTSVSADLFTGQTADRTVTLSNIGDGTLDFNIPAPALGEPMSQNPHLDLGKDEADPRHGDPVIAGAGGPDAFGYRWSDSDQPGGPAFAWTDISSTGTLIAVSGDDATSQPVALGFNMPFYGTLFPSIRVCTNGWLSFTSAATSYSNQPLPNSGAPENMVAPFWDDLNVTSGGQIFFQNFGNSAIVQWNNVPRYSSGGPYTFQAILDGSGAVTFQYLTMNAPLDGATIGIQNATKTDALQVAFNQTYMHDGLAVRISSIPQWLTAFPTSGRIAAGGSKVINLHMDASGLEGGTYPGAVNIQTNDPAHPVLVVNASLHVIGAPDATVQPASLDYGQSFLGQPYTRNLIVANPGTDTLIVSSIGSSHPGELVASPNTFNVPPKGSQNVVVTWTPAALGGFSGSLTVNSNDAGEPAIPVAVTGSSVPSPVMLVSPSSLSQTLYSGNTATQTLTVTNTGGPDLVVDAAADLGGGQLVYADDVGANGAGGPDAFGYRWKDSDASGGPAFNWVDISGTGTTISFSSSDDALSAAINMGMTFPFYGSNFSSLKVSTNGWLTFSTTETLNRNSNTTLPSSSGAANMVAIFWDDLHLRTGNVKYRNDGTRFIVQYTNVGRFTPSTGQSYTFQVQLYPNGKIVTQFLTMTTGTLNSATLGIQNGLKTVGLTANFNTNYVHNNLALQFSRTPDWLAVTPSHAVIPPNSSADFNVTFDATERLGGILTGAVVLNTNVPGQAQERVPATLTVIGAPIATIVPASYNYGTQFTGYSYLTSFQVVNTGTDTLNVSDVYSDNPNLFVEEAGFSGGENVPEAAFPLPPGAARLFELRWSATTPGTLAANVHVVSDDPLNGDKRMPVSGVAILPPVAAWTPSSFGEAMNAGDVLHRTLRVSNSGGSDLNFVTQVGLNSGATVTVDASPEIKKDEEDSRPGVLGAGGPDVYGYTWKDSDQAGGPAFSWVDISAVGTPITFASSDDANSGPFNLGFPFPFYGTSFSQARVTTNGWLSFTNTTTGLTNYLLPSASAPENLLAVFHDDLYQRTTQGANAKYWTDGNRFIVQWTNWDQLSPSGENYTFQAILYRNGRIVFQYLNMTTNDLNAATVGIQNGAKNDGLTVVYNAAYMHNNLAVEFRPPAGWLALNPEAGTIPPGGFVDVDVTFDATDLIGGVYGANIDLSTNDPANAAIRVPVSLAVTGIPDIDASPASLTFPTTYFGYTRTLSTSIRNVGTDVLTVTGASIGGDFTFTGLTTPVSLPVGASIPVTVTFAPTTSGTRTGSLDVTSDDFDESVLSIPLRGEGLFPPELAVSPDSLSAILPPSSQTTRMLQVCNTGGSDLNWTSGANIISGASVTPYEGYELAKGEEDTHPGILGSGGPDVFGYRWTDSDEAGGPAFNWVDITGIGTRITALDADDEVVGPLPIGFNFPFYGNPFNSLRVSSNGWLSFTYTGTTSLLTNAALPSTSGADNMIAMFWDDLSFSSTHGSGSAYYYDDGTRFILSFIDVPHYSSYSTGRYTFQVILYPNGKIVTQYLSMAGLLNSGTIGIQNAARNDGLTTVFNNPYVHDGLAVEFKAIPQWATLSPTDGVVLAGGCQDVTVTIDSTDLEHGIHDAMIRIQAQNDPYLAFEDVPVQLAVNNKPIAVPTGATVECTGNNSAAATLSGLGSSDPDGDPITYLWSAPGVTFNDPTSPTPTATFPLGDTTVTLVVNDGYENSVPATVVVRVQDTVPPAITSVGATPNYLWPPNHNMATVTTTVVATDVCDPSPVVLLVGVTSSEPDDVNGGGDGFTVNDIQGADTGTPDFQMLLRAERQGAGDGRVYTITYQAVDGSGHASAVAATGVDVPHSLGDIVEPIALRLNGKQNTVVDWAVVPGAVHYDVVRGNLSELRLSGQDVDLGRVTCLEQDSLDTSTSGHADTATPAPGQAFFYAVQFFDGIQESSYGSESVGRARVIKNGSGDCP